MKPKLLMTPGPTVVPEKVLKAMSQPIIHHRTPEFTEFVRESSERLKSIFKTKNDTYIMSGSGTAGMEASIASSISPGDHVVSVVSGKFSERYRDIAKAFGAEVTEIEYEWGKKIDTKRIKDALKEDTKAVTVVQNETSTGVLNPIWEIGEMTKDTETLLCVDTISCLAGDEVKVDDWNVDICVSGSQKCFSMPPGLAFVSVSEKAWKAVENSERHTYYNNLMKFKKKYPKPPWTPAISTLYGLEVALDIIEEEGIDNRIKRHKKNADYCRDKVQELGLDLFPENCDICSNTLTSIENEEAEFIRKRLNEDYDILVAGAQKHMKGKMFRIGHMGEVGREELERTLFALSEILR